MKPINLLVAVIGLVMGATPVSAAKWLNLGTDTNETVLYLDVETIKYSGNQVTVWQKGNHSRDKTTKVRETISRFRYDCAERTITIINMVEYYPDGKSEHFTWEPYRQKVDSIIPGSVAESAMKLVCVFYD